MNAGPRSRRSSVVRATLLATGLYALVLVVAPAFHHDLACHVKSPTHCTTCLVSVTAPGTQGAAGLIAADLRTSGALALERAPSVAPVSVAPLVGRSPPA